jgi:hypothetical protein
MTTAVDIADKVAQHAEQIASAMAVYHASPELRGAMIADAEIQMDRLIQAMLALDLKHKGEAFAAQIKDEPR